MNSGKKNSYLRVRVCSTGSTMLYSTAYPLVSPKKNFIKEGMFQSLIMILLLCNFPSESTYLSMTSVPYTDDWKSLGYFLQNAWVTVDQGC